MASSFGRSSMFPALHNVDELGRPRSGIGIPFLSCKPKNRPRPQRIRSAAVAAAGVNTVASERRTGRTGRWSNDDGEGLSVPPSADHVADTIEDDVSGKLDQWVKDSVVEILNKLDEAPFLVHIYSDGEDGLGHTRKSRVVKEKASAESWHWIKKRWNDTNPTPNGIILVEEIGSGNAVDASDEVNCGSVDVSSKSSSATKIWGILIQGKGGKYPACYILKTSRVQSVSGFCTHFCLVRVECFVENVDMQFKKSWLL